MKTTLASLFIVATIFMSGISLFGQQHVSTNTGTTTATDTYINSSRNGLNVLVIRDGLPWGHNVTVPILTGMGATVSTATSVTFPGLDFSLYQKIVVESVQSQAFYDAFQANLTKFEAYVNGGGILYVNSCTHGTSLNLPGGATSTTQYSDDGYHAAPGHPFLVGVPDPFYGDWASHNIITSLPAGAEVITRNIPGNAPTTVIYSLGSGTVIATGLTIEIAYYFELNGLGLFNFGLDMYPNMLGYIPAVPTPLSDWALVIGIVLIATFILIRYRRIA